MKHARRCSAISTLAMLVFGGAPSSVNADGWALPFSAITSVAGVESPNVTSKPYGRFGGVDIPPCTLASVLDLISKIFASRSLSGADAIFLAWTEQQCKLEDHEQLRSGRNFTKEVATDDGRIQYRFSDGKINIAVGVSIGDGTIRRELSSAGFRKTVIDDAF